MKSMLAVIVLLLSMSTAHAVPRIIVGDHVLQPNQPGQTISLFVTSGDPVQGIDLNVQIGDGGIITGGSHTSPMIENVDLLSGIFSGNHTGQSSGVSPLLWSASTTTDSGFVIADGLLAVLTISTVGSPGGYTRSLSLSPSELFGGATNFAGIPVDIANGTLRVVPEPSTTALLLPVTIGCAAALMARRRKDKKAASSGRQRASRTASEST